MKKFLLVLCVAATLAFSACKGASDADLQKAATDKVANPAVTVVVKDGVATVTGEVADQAAIDKATAAAKVDGVKSVVATGLKVKPTPPPVATMASTDDTGLKTKIDEGFKKAGCTGATVEVKGGVATARGTVPKGKLAPCVMAAQETKPGKFENQMSEAK
jgi:hyperosmotically inducible periplasmic protein